MITLTLLHPIQETPVQNWTFENEPVIRIGRSTDNNVILYSAVVSRHHVELRRGEKNWELLNLGTNGTYMDGKRITQAIVVDEVVIRLARSGPKIQIVASLDSHEKIYNYGGQGLRNANRASERKPQLQIPGRSRSPGSERKERYEPVVKEGKNPKDGFGGNDPLTVVPRDDEEQPSTKPDLNG